MLNILFYFTCMLIWPNLMLVYWKFCNTQLAYYWIFRTIFTPKTYAKHENLTSTILLCKHFSENFVFWGTIFLILNNFKIVRFPFLCINTLFDWKSAKFSFFRVYQSKYTLLTRCFLNAWLLCIIMLLFPRNSQLNIEMWTFLIVDVF